MTMIEIQALDNGAHNAKLELIGAEGHIQSALQQLQLIGILV